MPVRTANKTLIVGTWNIRNFDDNRFKNGPRLPESMRYIAEIVSAFDILAIQEINRDLGPLNRLMKILGYGYDYIITDVTEGRSGNRERLGFIFNKEKVRFKGVAGEVVLPDALLIDTVTKKRQFARTPFACSFQSGWFRFMLATVHIYYGAESKKSEEYKRRVKEIKKIAKELSKRAEQEEYNYLLVGDFNIEDYESGTFNALEKAGFEVFKNEKGSNLQQTRFFDQISFKVRESQLRLADSDRSNGVLNLFEHLFTEADYPEYKDAVKKTLGEKVKSLQEKLKNEKKASEKKKLEKRLDTMREMRKSDMESEKYFLEEWRTYQMSDHLPLWVELEIDFADQYLESLKTG
jgi:endonuclease/exonuclease/phosphatase family metal-dependent hydrolase